MEEKRRDPGTLMPPAGEFSPPAEPTSSRRRAGAHKRKATNLSSSGSSSTSSKRITREKASLAHPPIHNGPLTRARQVPSNLSSASGAGVVAASATGAKPAGHAKHPGGLAGETIVSVAEELRKQSELEALEAGLEAKFEAVRSRSTSAHVVPSHCGWFSWKSVHPIEERTLPSFFNGKSESRTPDVYLEIRNWIMKKFHANPNTQIELKDLSELEVGDLDARQEVMEFLDHWGLINFHPFPPTGPATGGAEDNVAAEKGSLADKLYHFETLQSSKPVVPKNNISAPAVSSGLFPESSIADELIRPEGPAVEYHCNSCSADCSRKRYHCQKQADFDLCTDCFNNGKFDSGMSSSDFILMEPGEIQGLSGGKWTDQETLLLLEALELYKENWNEIAEHVATKTKAQCILHFVQMPIEDSFFDSSDDSVSCSKETADPASSDKLAPKDAPETNDSETAANENQSTTSPTETSKEETTEDKASPDTLKPEHTDKGKVDQDTFKLDDGNETKGGEDAGENCAMKALKEAFEAVGYPLTPERPLSFAEVGNPAMALAAFLAHLVGPDVATASSHNSLKSLSGNSPGIELASRHCFLLEDPPNDVKEPAGLPSVVAEATNEDTVKEEAQADRGQKEDLSNDHCDKKNQDTALEEEQTLDVPNVETTEISHNAKEQDIIVTCEEVSGSISTSNKSSTSEIVKDQQPSTDELKSEAELPPSFVKDSEANSEEPLEPTKTSKDVEMSETTPEKNELQETVPSNVLKEPANSVEAQVDEASDSLPSKKNEDQHPIAVNSVGKPSSEEPRDIDMVPHSENSEKNESSQPAEPNVTDGKVEDLTKDGDKKNGMDIKEDNKIDKIKRAAVSAISAAAVKAKLLADQEEDQIRQLSMLLIEKQLLKLETKLGFFNEMENVLMRVREQLDRSRQRLYHERAQIIAARLGLPASSSRVAPSSLPTNRVHMNVTNSVPRPPLSMVPQRPPLSRPMGTGAPTPSIPLSTTTAGSQMQG
ncbi:SWI/SNF complex subunit SWI3D [Humulus lupulus]|uniref:SWI/SNF complex subunit SWI3D n=1 Tax=Humulus lupulus TaxID=3486 RepID=UPI002B40DCD7|nr:SWI/SNF complex subunit SWI3D [Humulus lupulus]